MLRRRLVWLLIPLSLLTLLSGCTQDDPGFSVLVTPDGTEVLIDAGSESISTITFTEHQIHEGDFYFVKGFADGTQTFLFVTPNTAVRADTELVVASEGEYEVLIYEGVTTSADGAALTEENANRNSLTNATVAMFQGPTLAGGALGDGGQGGDLIWSAKVSAARTAGTERTTHYEIIKKQDTKYWYQMTQIVGGTVYVDWDFHWYER